MYYRRLKFCIIYLALNRGCFEAVLMKNTPRPLGVNQPDVLGFLNQCWGDLLATVQNIVANHY
jgi:hypothetical protein